MPYSFFARYLIMFEDGKATNFFLEQIQYLTLLTYDICCIRQYDVHNTHMTDDEGEEPEE